MEEAAKETKARAHKRRRRRSRRAYWREKALRRRRRKRARPAGSPTTAMGPSVRTARRSAGQGKEQRKDTSGVSDNGYGTVREDRKEERRAYCLSVGQAKTHRTGVYGSADSAVGRAGGARRHTGQASNQQRRRRR